MMSLYFPLGIAEGNAFLGRKKEISRLENNILRGCHSLLLAPRRYGKTSLVKQVIHTINYPWVEIDLFVAQNEFSIEQKILKAVQSIMSEVDAPEKWIKTLSTYFRNCNKTWTVGIKGFKLELTPENHKDVPDNILVALNALEHVLAQKKQRAILFMDEFQEIANIKIGRAIEGAIRHFAQSSKHVVFIFSGSSRHMLMHMFGDKSRPLYALCDEIHLERLSSTDYRDYLYKVSYKTWRKSITEETFNTIIELTECHPRYTYNLCMKIWEYCLQKNKMPEKQDVLTTWNLLVKEKLKDMREVLNKKSKSQIKILSLVSLGYNKDLSGQLAQSKLGMSGSAIVQSLQLLEQDDYVEKLEDGSYRILDPLLKSMFMEYGSDYFISI